MSSSTKKKGGGVGIGGSSNNGWGSSSSNSKLNSSKFGSSSSFNSTSSNSSFKRSTSVPSSSNLSSSKKDNYSSKNSSSCSKNYGYIENKASNSSKSQNSRGKASSVSDGFGFSSSSGSKKSNTDFGSYSGNKSYSRSLSYNDPSKKDSFSSWSKPQDNRVQTSSIGFPSSKNSIFNSTSKSDKQTNSNSSSMFGISSSKNCSFNSAGPKLDKQVNSSSLVGIKDPSSKNSFFNSGSKSNQQANSNSSSGIGFSGNNRSTEKSYQGSLFGNISTPHNSNKSSLGVNSKSQEKKQTKFDGGIDFSSPTRSNSSSKKSHNKNILHDNFSPSIIDTSKKDSVLKSQINKDTEKSCYNKSSTGNNSQNLIDKSMGKNNFTSSCSKDQQATTQKSYPVMNIVPASDNQKSVKKSNFFSRSSSLSEKSFANTSNNKYLKSISADSNYNSQPSSSFGESNTDNRKLAVAKKLTDVPDHCYDKNESSLYSSDMWKKKDLDSDKKINQVNSSKTTGFGGLFSFSFSTGSKNKPLTKSLFGGIGDANSPKKYLSSVSPIETSPIKISKEFNHSNPMEKTEKKEQNQSQNMHNKNQINKYNLSTHELKDVGSKSCMTNFHKEMPISNASDDRSDLNKILTPKTDSQTNTVHQKNVISNSNQKGQLEVNSYPQQSHILGSPPCKTSDLQMPNNKIIKKFSKDLSGASVGLTNHHLSTPGSCTKENLISDSKANPTKQNLSLCSKQDLNKTQTSILQTPGYPLTQNFNASVGFSRKEEDTGLKKQSILTVDCKKMASCSMQLTNDTKEQKKSNNSVNNYDTKLSNKDTLHAHADSSVMNSAAKAKQMDQNITSKTNNIAISSEAKQSKDSGKVISKDLPHNSSFTADQLSPVSPLALGSASGFQDQKVLQNSNRNNNINLGFLLSNLTQGMGVGPLKKPPKKNKASKTKPTPEESIRRTSSDLGALTSSNLESKPQLNLNKNTTKPKLPQRPSTSPSLVGDSIMMSSLGIPMTVSERSQMSLLSSLMFPDVGHPQGPTNVTQGLAVSPLFRLNQRQIVRQKRNLDNENQRRHKNTQSSSHENPFETSNLTPFGLTAQGPSILANRRPQATLSTPQNQSLINHSMRTTPTAEEISSMKLKVQLIDIDDFKGTYERAIHAINNGKELTTEGIYSQACAEFEVGLKLIDCMLESKVDKTDMSAFDKTVCKSIQEVILLERKAALEGFSDAQAGILSPRGATPSAPESLEDVPSAPPSYDDVLREDLEKSFFSGGPDKATRGAFGVIPSLSSPSVISAPTTTSQPSILPPSYNDDHCISISNDKTEYGAELKFASAYNLIYNPTLEASAPEASATEASVVELSSDLALDAKSKTADHLLLNIHNNIAASQSSQEGKEGNVTKQSKKDMKMVNSKVTMKPETCRSEERIHDKEDNNIQQYLSKNSAQETHLLPYVEEMRDQLQKDENETTQCISKTKILNKLEDGNKESINNVPINKSSGEKEKNNVLEENTNDKEQKIIPNKGKVDIIKKSNLTYDNPIYGATSNQPLSPSVLENPSIKGVSTITKVPPDAVHAETSMKQTPEKEYVSLQECQTVVTDVSKNKYVEPEKNCSRITQTNLPLTLKSAPAVLDPFVFEDPFQFVENSLKSKAFDHLFIAEDKSTLDFEESTQQLFDKQSSSMDDFFQLTSATSSTNIHDNNDRFETEAFEEEIWGGSLTRSKSLTHFIPNDRTSFESNSWTQRFNDFPIYANCNTINATEENIYSVIKEKNSFVARSTIDSSYNAEEEPLYENFVKEKNRQILMTENCFKADDEALSYKDKNNVAKLLKIPIPTPRKNKKQSSLITNLSPHEDQPDSKETPQSAPVLISTSSSQSSATEIRRLSSSSYISSYTSSSSSSLYTTEPLVTSKFGLNLKQKWKYVSMWSLSTKSKLSSFDIKFGRSSFLTKAFENENSVNSPTIPDGSKISFRIEGIKIYFIKDGVTSPFQKQNLIIIEDEPSSDSRPVKKRIEVGHHLWTRNLDPIRTAVLKSVDNYYILKDSEDLFVGIKLPSKVKMKMKDNFEAILKSSSIYHRETFKRSLSLREYNKDRNSDNDDLDNKSPFVFSFQASDFSRKSMRAVQAIAKGFTGGRKPQSTPTPQSPIAPLEGEMAELERKGRILEEANDRKSIVYF